jgi:hypothetical protein
VTQPPSATELTRMLRAYFRDGRLVVMPRSGRRRQVVLEHIAQLFEPGRRYPEDEVNRMLRPVWDDVAALRRYLVDAALLDRAGGEYWRIGGPVEV